MEALAALVGESAVIAEVKATAGRLLRHQSPGRRIPPLLILGETGTGKGLVARALHRASARAGEPFVTVNCAALPESLLESELFGFERGAFTDAHRAKAGLFEEAHGGTLFLDEVGALPLTLQAKLLTALEDRTIRRLGSTKSVAVDLWIVSATSEELPAATRERRFREDLYHRLSALTLSMPPLRERGTDVIFLAEHFLAEVCREYGLAPKTLSAGAKAALLDYPWPGNVRELANLMERVALLVDGDAVDTASLGLPASTRVDTVETSPGPLKASLEDFERRQLKVALEAARGNLSRAAVQLGVPRNTLRYRLSKYGLIPPGPRERRGAPDVDAPSTRTTRTAAFVWVKPLDVAHRDLAPAVAEKVTAFDGRLEETDETGMLAVFGLTGDADPCASAVHAALAIRTAAERMTREALAPVRVGLAIHVQACALEESADGIGVATTSRREVIDAIGGVAAHLEREAILITPAAVPLVQGSFVVAMPSAAGDPSGPARLVTRTPSATAKPSIAVLPFRMLAADAQHDYLGDGMTEDIIGALSRLRWLFVIAHTSTLVYRAQPQDLPKIAAELGVRYVLTGSVRKHGTGVRVSAELVDAEGGNAIWAERYDGTLTEIFDLQDRITARIAGTLDIRLRLAEIQRSMHKRPESLDAYECVLRSISLLYRLSPNDFAAAGSLLERAVALDPDFAAAYAWRAWWCLFKIGQGWAGDKAEFAEAGRLAEQALERDPDDPMALAVSGHVAAILHCDYDTALRRFERSLALNPNFAFAWGLSGATFCYIGEPAVALDRVAYAMRLSPFDPMTFYFFSVAALAEWLRGRSEEALSWAQKARRENPRFTSNLRLLVACLAGLGRLEEAREVAREFLAIETKFTIGEFIRGYALRDRAALEQYAAGLARAGLPQ
jgi:transcriptional regulator with AAA-type ATPase domain/TolB-like protein/Tfp pilus assembly protein PilF